MNVGWHRQGAGARCRTRRERQSRRAAAAWCGVLRSCRMIRWRQRAARVHQGCSRIRPGQRLLPLTPPASGCVCEWGKSLRRCSATLARWQHKPQIEPIPGNGVSRRGKGRRGECVCVWDNTRAGGVGGALRARDLSPEEGRGTGGSQPPPSVIAAALMIERRMNCLFIMFMPELGTTGTARRRRRRLRVKY